MAEAMPLPAITNRRVWAIAGPIIVSNSTVPLIGIADTAVIGHLGDAALIAAIALGALVINALYWIFNFLRMGTTGLVAQALGARDTLEMRSAIQRATLLGLAVGCVMVVVQVPLARAIFLGFEASAGVETLAAEYFAIRIWGAPAMLANFAVLGWFIGLQRADIALYLQLYLNIANLLLDLVFVLGFGMDVDGVAYGTLLAEWTTFAAGLVLVIWYARDITGAANAPGDRKRLLDTNALRKMLSVNGDILIRSAFLMSAFIWLTAQSAVQGDVVFAANSILMHFYYIAAYALDAFAYASEALVGESKGAGDARRLRRAVVLSSLWAGAWAVAFALIFWSAGATFISLLTSVPEVKTTAIAYLGWAIIFPIVSVASYQLDGIFVGATRTADMRNMMILSFAVFIAAWWLLQPYGNHGLWAAFILFNVVRAITLSSRYRALERSTLPAAL